MNKKNPNHIDCATALEWIHLSLDQELPALDQQKLFAHVQGCKNCSAAQRELRLIENAHAELDRPMDAVPAGYFEELPGRVMARIAKAEARSARVFSLPKPQLPHWRAPRWLQQILFGRGKYAVAFAALAFLALIINRQRREDLYGPTPRQPQTSPTPAPSMNT